MRTIGGRATCVLAVLGIVVGCGGASARTTGASQAQPETQAPTPVPFRVMSFNLRFDHPPDGEHAWPNRRDRVAALIRFHHPDLLGVQEALPHQVTELEERLDGYGWFGAGREGPAGGETSAIFYRRSRFELLEEATLWLSPTPEIPSLGWDARHNRVVTWGKLRDRRTGHAIFLFNTHFDHVGVEARKQSASLLVERIRSLRGDSPAILTGDFNAEPDSEPYALVAAALRDARAVSAEGHYGPDGTASDAAAFAVRTEPLRRIDYIFVTEELDVLRHGAISQHERGIYPSDHLPVVADVVVGER